MITTPIIPGDISDTKNIVFAEIQIPGLNGQPIQSGGMGNRKISFTLQIINRDGLVGNLFLLKQIESLRNPAFRFNNIMQKTTQFNPNPKVLYYWGTNSVPLIYYVSKADIVHKGGWVNSFGKPKYSEVNIELILDEFHPLNKAEEIYRALSAITGQGLGAGAIFQQAIGQRSY